MMGEELNGAEITDGGLLGDRAYALVDVETGKVISAKNPKKWPNFFTYRAAFSAPPVQNGLQPVWITLPDGTVLRSDQSDINEKLSQYLGHKVVLQTQSPKMPSWNNFGLNMKAKPTKCPMRQWRAMRHKARFSTMPLCTC